MSQQVISDFRAAVEADRELQNDVRAELAKGDGADLAALGRRHGFEFTTEEFNEAWAASRSEGELTRFEMEMVSAGGAKKSK
jgi:predicted ribosomally synthesized peptide with nif11-like leader